MRKDKRSTGLESQLNQFSTYCPISFEIQMRSKVITAKGSPVDLTLQPHQKENHVDG